LSVRFVTTERDSTGVCLEIRLLSGLQSPPFVVPPVFSAFDRLPSRPMVPVWLPSTLHFRREIPFWIPPLDLIVLRNPSKRASRFTCLRAFSGSKDGMPPHSPSKRATIASASLCVLRALTYDVPLHPPIVQNTRCGLWADITMPDKGRHRFHATRKDTRCSQRSECSRYMGRFLVLSRSSLLVGVVEKTHAARSMRRSSSKISVSPQASIHAVLMEPQFRGIQTLWSSSIGSRNLHTFDTFEHTTARHSPSLTVRIAVCPRSSDASTAKMPPRGAHKHTKYT